MGDKWTEEKGEPWKGEVKQDVSFIAVSLPELLENIQEYIESVKDKKGFINASFTYSPWEDDQPGFSPYYGDGRWHETIHVFWVKE